MCIGMLLFYQKTKEDTTMEIPRPEYPRPQFEREQWKNLNGEWAFEIDNGRSG